MIFYSNFRFFTDSSFSKFPKCLNWTFKFWHFPTIFVLSGNTAWPASFSFSKTCQIDHFWHFWWTFVHSKCKRSVARLARIVEWDFFGDFQTLWVITTEGTQWCNGKRSENSWISLDFLCANRFYWLLKNGIQNGNFARFFAPAFFNFQVCIQLLCKEFYFQFTTWKSQKKSHSTLRAKRATFWVAKS